MIEPIVKNLTCRVAVKLIISFIVGIFFESLYTYRAGILCFCVFLVFAVLFTVLLIFNNYKKFAWIPAFLLLFYCLGLFSVKYKDFSVNKELVSQIGNSNWYHGEVISSPKLTGKNTYYSVEIEIHSYESDNKRIPISGTAKIFVKNWQNKFPEINDSVVFHTEFERPETFSDAFDYELYLKAKNIFVRGFTNNLYIDETPHTNTSIFQKICHFGREINNVFSDRIDYLFKYDNNANSVIKGILLGAKEDFSEELAAGFSKTGISHITAVSGLHLNVLIGVICGLFSIFGIKKRTTSFIIFPIVLLFMAIIGFTPSVSRAGIMILILLISQIIKNRYDSLTALFVSAFIILLHNPYSLFSMSFVLSFTASLSIILLNEPINSFLENLFCYRFKWLTDSLSVSVSSFVGIFPLVAYYFNTLSPVSIFVNLWIIPLCSVVLILGYLCIFASFILPKYILYLLIFPIATCTDLIMKTSEYFSFFSLQGNLFKNPYVLCIYYFAVRLIYALTFEKYDYESDVQSIFP